MPPCPFSRVLGRLRALWDVLRSLAAAIIRAAPTAWDVLPSQEVLPAAWVPLKTRSISRRFPKNFRPGF